MNGKSKNRSGWRRLTNIFLIAAGLYLLYFAGLGSFPLLDPDEPVYGQVAKEMAAGGGWLSPHLNGGLQFDKPPMFYWLSAASTSVLGSSEAAARLPSAVLAVGLVLLVYALASYDFGKRVGVLSAVVMSTCFLQIWLGHGAVTDMTFVFFLTAALYGYRRWLDAEGRARFGWMALCGAMTGFAMLTKGPVAPFLLFVTFVIHLLWTKRIKRLVSADALVGIAAALVVGLPWFLLMLSLHREKFYKDFILDNNVGRFTNAEHKGMTGKWYSRFLNIPFIMAFFFPWSIFLPQAIIRVRKANDGAKLAWVWFAVVFVFFSISKTILITYIFPLYPAAALFVGALWASAASDDYRIKRGIRIALSTGLVFALLLTGALLKYTQKRFPEAENAAVVFGVVLVLALASSLVYMLFYKRSEITRAVWITGVGMIAISPLLIFGIVPLVLPRASTYELVKDARNLPGVSAAQVYEYKLQKPEVRLARYPSLSYYLGCKTQRVFKVSIVDGILRGNAPAIVVCKKDVVEKILVPGAIQLAESGELAIVGNAAASSKGTRVR